MTTILQLPGSMISWLHKSLQRACKRLNTVGENLMKHLSYDILILCIRKSLHHQIVLKSYLMLNAFHRQLNLACISSRNQKDVCFKLGSFFCALTDTMFWMKLFLCILGCFAYQGSLESMSKMLQSTQHKTWGQQYEKAFVSSF